MEKLFKIYDQACKDIAWSIWLNLHRNGEGSAIAQVIGYLVAIIMMLIGEGLLFGAGAVLVSLALFIVTGVKVGIHFANFENNNIN